jgi:integrase/recombinase XerD
MLCTSSRCSPTLKGSALAGFLAGYSGPTRDAYALDLRQYASWCQRNGVHVFHARRSDFECFGRDMEARGRARATVARRLCTVSGFYRYAAEEELLEHSPAVHVRRPRLDCESHAIGLDRNEVGRSSSRPDSVQRTDTPDLPACH